MSLFIYPTIDDVFEQTIRAVFHSNITNTMQTLVLIKIMPIMNSKMVTGSHDKISVLYKTGICCKYE